MAKKINVFKVLVNQGRKIFKKHIVLEYTIPIVITIIVAFIVIFGKLSNILEILLLVLFSLIVYLFLTAARLINESTESAYYDTDGNKLNFELLSQNTDEFFCTSIIPIVLDSFSDWFKAEIIENFSFITANRIANNNYKACRVIIFINPEDLYAIKCFAFLEGSYARRVSNIHHNSDIDIAYLQVNDFIRICNPANQEYKHFDIAIFRSQNTSKYVLRAEDIGGRSLFDPFRKFTYKTLTNTIEQQNAESIMNNLKATIYNNNILKPEYDFYQFLKC